MAEGSAPSDRDAVGVDVPVRVSLVVGVLAGVPVLDRVIVAADVAVAVTDADWPGAREGVAEEEAGGQ